MNMEVADPLLHCHVRDKTTRRHVPEEP